ncbi:hypothetical protein Tco_1266598 [Tanacetum coccineum]
MAALRYRDEHNKVGYLQKPKGSDDYHQVLEFLRASHLRSPELGPLAILATIDETPYTITEDSVRSQLQLADDGGIDDTLEVFGPHHSSLSQYRSWDQFGSSLAVALICLSDGRKFNWSSYIFKGMLSSKLFANMKLNFEGQPMQLLAAMLPQVQKGEGAGVAAQAVPPPILVPMPGSDQPQDHLSTPPRQQTSDPINHVFEHGQRGAEDLITPTAVSSVVSTLVQKVNLLETELKDTKKLFKDVVGKLVKKFKAMEQDVDLDALLALANAAVIVDSNIPPGGASSSHILADVPTGVAHAGVSNKGKNSNGGRRHYCQRKDTKADGR